MRRFSAVAIVLGSVMPFAAGASELKPLQAGTFVLGDQTASVYYTQSGDTFEVVTTIGPTDGSGAPVRVTGFLLPDRSRWSRSGRTARQPSRRSWSWCTAGRCSWLSRRRRSSQAGRYWGDRTALTTGS